MDKEWYEVVVDGQSTGPAFPNEDYANTAAETQAAKSDGTVCVVYNRRTEIRRFQRQVTVTATDVAAVPALSAETKA